MAEGVRVFLSILLMMCAFIYRFSLSKFDYHGQTTPEIKMRP